MRCNNKLFDKRIYSEEPGVEPYPVLKVELYRSELDKTVRTEALVDTGFDDA